MKILITGIGCIGKSTRRERISIDFPDKVISADMDYTSKIPSDKDKEVIVESVYGFENNSEFFDRIQYLLLHSWHIILWLKRGWAWFVSGIEDRSAPKGKRKPFAKSYFPIILKILARNILMCRRWLKADLFKIKDELRNKTFIISSIEKGYWICNSWIVDNIYCINCFRNRR